MCVPIYLVREFSLVVKLLTDCISDKPPEMEGFPMKLWNIEIFLLDEQENECPAKVYTKAVYNLHPSFKNPTQSSSSPL